MIFCDWLLLLSIRFSKFIYVVTCINHFYCQIYSIIWICHILFIHYYSVDIWMFPLFRCNGPWSYGHLCATLCSPLIFQILWGNPQTLPLHSWTLKPQLHQTYCVILYMCFSFSELLFPLQSVLAESQCSKVMLIQETQNTFKCYVFTTVLHNGWLANAFFLSQFKSYKLCRPNLEIRHNKL